MNPKQLITIVAIGLVVGGISLAVYLRTASSWEGAPKGTASAKVLGDFPLNDVAQVNIKTSEQTLTLSKKGEAWVVANRGDYPANFAKVGNTIRALWDLVPLQEMQVGASQLGRFTLLTPGGDKASEDEAGTLVELQNADAKIITTLLLGKNHLKPTPQFPEDAGIPVGRYVLPVSASASNSPSKVFLVSEVFEELNAEPTDWLEKGFFRAEKVKSIELTGTSAWKLTRENAEAEEWVLADAKPDETVAKDKVSSFGSLLATLSFSDVLPKEEKLGDADHTITAETFDNFRYVITLGKERGDDVPLSVTVEANLPKERTPAADEKPEDKKKLDDDFEAENKKLADKLKEEKALEGRVFLVSKGSFTSLLVPRSALLKEPEPAPAATPSASPSAAAESPKAKDKKTGAKPSASAKAAKP